MTKRDGPDCTCGGTIPAGRRDGFCSSWCAGRDTQGLEPLAPPPRFTSSSPAAAAAALVPAGDAGEHTRPRYRQRRRLIADEVEDRLRDADMVGSWQGAAALDLADALDWQGGSGSARAALHKQLREVMADLLRGQDEPGSTVGAMRDELAARRARRVGGA